jgi:pyruvate dehydrogenase E1 component alpha subunit
MGTFYHRVSAVKDFAVMGSAYNIPGKTIDGMDAIEVYEEVSSAARIAREGNPVFLEIKTYRYKGHSMSDPAKYRTKEELEDYKKQDPILILKSMMEKDGLISEEEYAQMDAKAKEISAQSVKFAEESPEPAASALYEDIYA